MESDTNKPEILDSTDEKKKKMPVWLEVLIGFVGIALIVGLVYLIRPKADEGDQDLSWVNVERAGVLLVGTAADYKPFSYYDEQNSIDGFDIALIREISTRLGVKASIADHAFEGLTGALYVDQIDVAIAAISVTTDREVLSDFTNVYYVTEDAILTKADSDIQSISKLDNFNNRRIGVQRGTVHEAWVKSALVQGGHIALDNLFVYDKPVDAINDLEKGYLDLVIMDLHPAEVVVTERGVRLVGQGFNQQRFAIEVKGGAHALRMQLDSALEQLQNDGTLALLVNAYLGLSPTDPPCVDAMNLVEDLSYYDNNLTEIPTIDPGEAFQKGWRLQNTGTCIWNESYQLKYERGNNDDAHMSGKPVRIVGEVNPGETYDIYVDLIAPDRKGEYIGFWQIHNKDELPFGVTIWVAVEVVKDEPGVPTSTPEPSEPTPTEDVPQPTAEPTPTVDVPQPTAELSPTPELTFAGKTFTFFSILEQPPILDSPLQIYFTSADLFIGQGGCNLFSGTYEYVDESHNEGEIKFDLETITRQYCDEPEDVMVLEEAFITNLELVEEFLLEDDGRLLIFSHEICDDGEEVCEEDEMIDEELLRGDLK